MNRQKHSPNSQCKSCGCRDVTTRYKDEGERYRACYSRGVAVPKHEHLYRRCTCCGFGWWEKCLDEEALKALDKKIQKSEKAFFFVIEGIKEQARSKLRKENK